MSPDWRLAFVLPNLQAPITVDDLSGYVALAHYDDPRVQVIAQHQPGARKFLEGFWDQYGHSQKPSAVIYRTDIPCPSEVLRRAWVDFRNVVALAAILPGWAQVRPDPAHGAPPNPLWGDVFAAYPGLLGDDGAIHSINPAQMILAHPHAPFAAMPDPAIPVYRDPFSLDVPLLAHLLRRWKERYIGTRATGSRHEALFRSLEMAYRATLVPGWNEGSVYDFGTTLGLWVSALEILAHPGRSRQVNRQQVVDLLGRARWIAPQLKRRQYKSRIRNRTTRETLAQRLCHHVYEARNAFLHGNRITERHWRVGSRFVKTPLNHLAPSLYRTAVLVWLGWDVPAALVRQMHGKIVYARPGWPKLVELSEIAILWCNRFYEDQFLSLVV